MPRDPITHRWIDETTGGSPPLIGGQPVGMKPSNGKGAASAISLEQMLSEASRLAGIEDSNQAREYGRLNAAAGDFSRGFAADDERATRLSLGSMFDDIGQGSLDQSRQMRTQLGGRGIDPSSGTAAALANRIGMQKESLRYGAMRSAAQDSYQRRNANRAAQYAQQAGIAQFGSQSPSLLRLDSLTNKAEFDLAREVSKDQVDAAKYKSKKDAEGQKSAGIGNIIGSVLGLL